MSKYQIGDIVVVTSGSELVDEYGLDDQVEGQYHYIRVGTVVRIQDVTEKTDRHTDGWGHQYYVAPIDDSPDCWVDDEDQGHQYVYDIHLGEKLPAKFPSLTDVEAFLNTASPSTTSTKGVHT